MVGWTKRRLAPPRPTQPRTRPQRTRTSVPPARCAGPARCGRRRTQRPGPTAQGPRPSGPPAPPPLGLQEVEARGRRTREGSRGPHELRRPLTWSHRPNASRMGAAVGHATAPTRARQRTARESRRVPDGCSHAGGIGATAGAGAAAHATFPSQWGKPQDLPRSATKRGAGSDFPLWTRGHSWLVRRSPPPPSPRVYIRVVLV